MVENIKRLSKFMAVVLRHSPDQFGITLDEQGYAPLDEVWQVIEEKYGNRFTMDDVATVVAGDQRGKKRYEITGNQIRALYGHSKPAVIYPVIEPPLILYHGTSPAAWQLIQENGLQSQGRQYVHLTTNRENARIVARRKSSHPVMLVIRSLEAHQAGIVFHQPEAEHYLALAIPATFIDMED